MKPGGSLLSSLVHMKHPHGMVPNECNFPGFLRSVCDEGGRDWSAKIVCVSGQFKHEMMVMVMVVPFF